MEIGGNVTYNGKCYVLRGLEPMSVPDRRAELEDPESGELISVPVALLEDAPNGEVERFRPELTSPASRLCRRCRSTG